MLNRQVPAYVLEPFSTNEKDEWLNEFRSGISLSIDHLCSSNDHQFTQNLQSRLNQNSKLANQFTQNSVLPKSHQFTQNLQNRYQKDNNVAPKDVK